MATKKNRTGLYLLLATLVLGGGAVAYFFYFKPKIDEKKKLKNEPAPIIPPDTPPSNTVTLKETPFKNEGQGNAFRAWVNKNYPAYAKTLDLDEVGKTQTTAIKTAWEKYGDAYIKGNPNWEKYEGALSSTGIPAKLQPFIDRKVATAKDIKTNSTGTMYIGLGGKTPKGTQYGVVFNDQGGFRLYDSSGSKDTTWFIGGYSDGGRTLKVEKDEYSGIYKTTSKKDKTIKKDGLYKALDALFMTA